MMSSVNGIITSPVFAHLAGLADFYGSQAVGMRVATDGWMVGDLHVCEIVREHGEVVCVMVSADGLPFTVWDDRAAGDGVYGEAWRAHGVTWRGWVHPETRRVVQTAPL
jgi:hypothetical protein